MVETKIRPVDKTLPKTLDTFGWLTNRSKGKPRLSLLFSFNYPSSPNSQATEAIKIEALTALWKSVVLQRNLSFTSGPPEDW